MFIYKFKYIKDFSKILMEEKCNNIYCEAETDRYQIAKNSYNLLLPNDIFNSKTYIIMTFIVSIMIYIYYYYLLFDNVGNNKFNYILYLLLLLILLGMIILRYTPYDEAGYLNYFRDFDKNNAATFNTFVSISVIFIIPIIIYLIKKNEIKLNPNLIIPILIKSICFILSIVIMFNLMNIVMSFRNNTKPILKTENLAVSLEKSFKMLYSKFKPEDIVLLNTIIKPELKFFNELKDNITTKYCKDSNDKSIKKNGETYIASPKTNELIISSILNILRAFNELSIIILNNYIDPSKIVSTKEAIDLYIINLKNIINDNKSYIEANYNKEKDSYISEVSFIYDNTVKIPFTYEENNNKNENNTDYIYTSDISYNSPNLFYEKYWDIDLDKLLLKNDYFVSTKLFFNIRPNIFKIFVMVIILLVIIICIYTMYTYFYPNALIEHNIFTILQPLIMFLILIIFIGIFIRFNTMFNKYVVYMCLDSSYKRSLNKLNNIVSPYIQMYNNKIVYSNKSYIRHYIITNVFYSIISGNIKLNEITPTLPATPTLPELIPINEINDNIKYYNIDRIEENSLKFANMNNSILSNSDLFKSYYNERFQGIYTATYNEINAEKLYNIFQHIFNLSDVETIDNYFKKIISIDKDTGTLSKIYYIIKKCFELFDEDKFNYNLIYYKSKDKKEKNNILNKYKNFKFFKSIDEVIPYKFILTLKTKKEYESFITDDIEEKADEMRQRLIENLKDNFNITINKVDEIEVDTDVTKILEDNDVEDIASQASDIEKKQDKNLLKIIAKYLLILGHINQNRIEYKAEISSIEKGKIYEKKSANLYRLIYDTSYTDIFEIRDTFNIDDCSKDCSSYLSYINVMKTGSGYTSVPTIEITEGGGTGASAIAQLTPTTISSISVTGGSGYTNPISVKITGGGGTGASAEATISNGNINITVIDGGIDYTSEPKIEIKGGSGSGATSTVNFSSHTISSIKVTNGGSGYTSNTIIKFIGGGGGRDAEAEAIISKGSIKSINITRKGIGYTSVPTIEIIGDGKEARAEAKIIGTGIGRINLTNRGKSFRDKPTIRIKNGGGSGAEAEAYLQERIINDKKYKNLTYIYNYLETKYVNVSSNNNKNYLMNIIKSINNQINGNDEKSFNNNNNNTLYLFRDKINNMNNPNEYDNEQEILNIANNISTTSFGGTYISNIVIMLLCYYIISRTIK